MKRTMMIRIPAFTPLLLSTLIAGCAVGPDYVRPAVETPQSFKEAQGFQQWQQLDNNLAATVPLDWWKVFDDPILNELAEQVSINNQNIKLAEAQYSSARAAVDSASAAAYPTLSSTFSHTRAANAIVTNSNSTQSQSASTATSTNTLGLSASWELDSWGRIRRGLESADATLQASAADLAAAQLSAQALLVQTYIELRGAEAQVALQQRTVDAYTHYLQLTRNRFAVGVAAELDVSNAESQLATAKASALAAELQRSQYEHALATLVGKPPASFSLTTTATLPLQPQVPQLVPSIWLATRPDIVAAERRVAAANAQIGIAKAAWFPTLTLGASGGYRNSSMSDLIDTAHRYWSAGPTLALSLFDGGARSAAVASARASYDQTVATYRQTVLTAFQEVEDNLAAVRLTDAEAKERNTAAKSARRSREIAVNQYTAGTGDQLAVIVAQASELAAEQTLITARQSQLLAAVVLYKNTGQIPSTTQEK